jgi:methionyl aminopeptidase
MGKPNIDALRQSGQINTQTLTDLVPAVQPGISTAELDQLAEQAIREAGGTPAFLGYRGYPSTLCTSVNEAVVHGMPGPAQLVEGDIITLDLGVKVDGWYTDAALTLPVGKISPEAQTLLNITWDALYAGLAVVRPGHTVGDYGHTVQKLVEDAGLGVVRDCVGHGIGQQLHEDPSIPNYGQPGEGAAFTEQMVVAVEPMITSGSWEVETADDHWTIRTRDHSLAAHFETTVLVTEDGPEELVPLPDVLRRGKASARLGKVTRDGSARSIVRNPRG